MKSKFFLYNTLFLVWGSLFSVNGQVYPDRYMIQGSILTDDAHEAIPMAQIINKTHRHEINSDTLGGFSIRAGLNDTLFISALGYYPREIIVKDSLIWQSGYLKIYLNEEVNDLGEIDIQTLGTYEDFKYKVLHLQLEPNINEELIESLKQSLQKELGLRTGSSGALVIGSPISALYNTFSKEGKSIAHYKKQLAEEMVWKEVRKKYNRDIVTRVTGLTGDSLDKFMVFCSIDVQYVLLASEYDVIKKVNDCFDIFKQDVLRQNAGN